MKASVAFVIACILMASAQAGNLDNFFSEIGDSEFAQTMISTINLQVSSGERVDGLISGIRQVKASLETQMKNAQDVYQNTKGSCDDDLRGLAAGITQAGTDMAKYQIMVHFDHQTYISRQEELANKQRELGDRQAMLDTLSEQREAETETYTTTITEYKNVFGLIESIKEVIQNKLVKKEGQFLQMKSQMRSTLVRKIENFQTAPQGVAHGYHAFFKLMAQILQKSEEVHADQSIIQNILDACDRIAENLDRAQALERDAERTRQADFEELSDKVTEQIRGVTAAIVGVQSEITTLENSYEASVQKFTIAQQSMENLNSRLTLRGAECQANQEVWENFYNNITEELAVCSKIMYLLEDKRALLARYGL